MPLTYPNTEIVSLSQVIEPNEVERFAITLGNDLPRANKYVYQVNVLFIYDGDNKTIPTQHMLILSRRPSRILGSHTNSARVEYCRQNNKKVLAEIKETNAVKSKAITHIVNSQEPFP